MCNVRYNQIHNLVKQTGSFRNMLTITIFIGIEFGYLVTNAKHTFKGVLGFSIVVRFVITRLVILLASIDSAFKRRELLKLGKLMQRYMTQLKQQKLIIRSPPVIIRLQIGTILIVTCIVNSAYIYHSWPHITILSGYLMIINALIGLYIQGSLIFPQYFAHFLADELYQLRSNLPNRTLQSSLDDADKLKEIKAAIMATFGIQLLLFLFQQLFNIAFSSYEILNSFFAFSVKFEGVVMILLAIVTVLLLNVLVLFGVTYNFDRCESEVG